MIRVTVMGASGKIGREVCKAVIEDPELDLVGAVDPASLVEEIPFELVKSGITPLKSRDELNTGAIDVMVDFTRADAAVDNIIWAMENGIHSVVGTTGIPENDLKRIEVLADKGKANIVLAANFALGAVLMMKFSEAAAGVFDQCEIIEMHHRGKLDSPSGTAIETAKRVGRLGEVQIHSVRLDGLVAHQEVTFGSRGETLRIRHDTIDRSCFMPGVLIAVKKVASTPGLTMGLEPLLDI